MGVRYGVAHGQLDNHLPSEVLAVQSRVDTETAGKAPDVPELQVRPVG